MRAADRRPDATLTARGPPLHRGSGRGARMGLHVGFYRTSWLCYPTERMWTCRGPIATPPSVVCTAGGTFGELPSSFG